MNLKSLRSTKKKEKACKKKITQFFMNLNNLKLGKRSKNLFGSKKLNEIKKLKTDSKKIKKLRKRRITITKEGKMKEKLPKFFIKTFFPEKEQLKNKNYDNEGRSEKIFPQEGENSILRETQISSSFVTHEGARMNSTMLPSHGISNLETEKYKIQQNLKSQKIELSTSSQKIYDKFLVLEEHFKDKEAEKSAFPRLRFMTILKKFNNQKL